MGGRAMSSHGKPMTCVPHEPADGFKAVITLSPQRFDSFAMEIDARRRFGPTNFGQAYRPLRALGERQEWRARGRSALCYWWRWRVPPLPDRPTCPTIPYLPTTSILRSIRLTAEPPRRGDSGA